MRYFTDTQLKEMEQKIKTDYNGKTGAIFLAYLQKITELNRQCGEGLDKHEELMKAIAQMQAFADQYVPHDEKVDINDNDADAYEYENYDYEPNTDN